MTRAVTGTLALLPGQRRHRVVTATLRIRRTPLAVRDARHWFRGFLRELDGDAAACAELVFAEITTNAADHGRWGKVTIKVQVFPGRVGCDVRDRNWRLPHAASSRLPGREDGRGMEIVQKLASNWGVRRDLLGKAVWFTVEAVPSGHCEGASTQ